MVVIDPRVLTKTVKAVAPKKERTIEAQIRGTVVYSGGEHYIQLDGATSESLTPIANSEEGLTETAFVNGDRVLVLIKNHQAIVTKNITTGLQAQTAREALETAEDAAEAAHQATGYAQDAHDAAEEAKNEASEAKEAADSAVEDADAAYRAAEEANYAANGALTQLSVVEDVVGTLNWVSSHGKYTKTEDTEIDPDKTYFIKVNGIFTPVVNPEKSQIKRYYELSLDDSIQNYISSHLALTDEGLYVVKDDLGYKILLANDGMKVYDNEGHLVSTFGEYVKFSSEKPQYIGSDDAYIIFDPTTKQINIGGNVVIGGELTLDKLLSEVNSLEVEYTLSTDYSQAFFTAKIFRGHDDVTTEFDPRCFTWYYKTEDGEAPINGNNGSNTGYTMTVNINELFDFEGHVITHFTHSYVDYYIENGHACVKADSVDPADIGEFGFTIDEHGDLIYSYNNTVADFELIDGRLYAKNQYGIFGNKLTRETAVYKKGALAKALSEKADNQDFFQAEQLIYIQATSAVDNVQPYREAWVEYSGEPVRGTPPDAETGQTPRWTLKKPTYQTNYPVTFIAKQTLTKKTDGTTEIGCSQPLMDDSQTILDGGHITTGTIDASKVNVTNIDAGNIIANTLTIGRVQGLNTALNAAANTADSYISEIGSDGIRVHDANTVNNSIVIDSTGMEVFKGGTAAANSVAKYGDSARVGKEASNNIFVDANGIAIKNGANELATFSSNSIELGKNSTTAEVKFCNDSLKITGSIEDGVSYANIDNITNATMKATRAKLSNGVIMEIYEDDYESYPDAGFNIFARQGANTNNVSISGRVVDGDATDTYLRLSAGDTAGVDIRASTTDIAAPHVMIGGRLVVDGGLIKNLAGYDNTVSADVNMYITSNGYIRRSTKVSSRRYKHDIDEVKIKELDPHHLYDIEVRQFKYNDDVITDKNDCRYGKDLIGFIAEQVKEVYPIAVDVNEDGECESWNAQYMIPPMLKLIQEQHEQIKELTKHVEALERIQK